MSIKKNIHSPGFRIAIVIFMLLFFSFRPKAQEEKMDSIVADTTVVTSTDDEGIEGLTHNGIQYFKNREDTLSVELRNVPPDAVKKMKEDEDFWYADADIHSKKSKEEIAYEREHGKKAQKGKDEQAIREREQQQQQDSSYTPLGQRSWFQTLLWIIILAVFATGLAVYLGGSNVALFRKKNRGTTGDGEEEITEDIFAINYQKEIDKAAAQGNYRLAIRLLFLRLLKNMSEKNIIRYKQDKTNLDYLLELHPTNYYNHFFRLTRNYEYSWYGQFAVSEENYQLIRGEFDHFDKELK